MRHHPAACGSASRPTPSRRSATTSNVIADYPGGRTDHTLIVGGHLDSVPEGPGINDNGSGMAGILEIALQMKKLGIKPTNHVRFAFWGAEESGPPQWGSQHYVDHLAQPAPSRRHRLLPELRHDRLAELRQVRLRRRQPGPRPRFGTDREVFLDYFASQNLATEPTPFDGRSDYQAFLNEGIPAGGAISGDAGIKTDEQASDTAAARAAYDPCYHQVCDPTLKDVDRG